MASNPTGAEFPELKPPEIFLGETINDLRPRSSASSNTSLVDKAITYKIRSIRLSNTHKGPYIPPLLGLPRELRQLIYFHTLASPTTRWTTRHALHCKLRERRATIEHAPFYSTHCLCARRHSGLNLLLVCKQIRAEAAPVWYKSNTICYESGDKLREHLESVPLKHKEIIREISMMGDWQTVDPSSIRQSQFYFRYERRSTIHPDLVWTSLLECKGLRRLEIRPEHVSSQVGRHFTGNVSRLRDMGCQIVLVMCVMPAVLPHRQAWQQPPPITCPELFNIRIVVKQDIGDVVSKTAADHFKSELVPQCQQTAGEELALIKITRPKEFNTLLSPYTLTLRPGVLKTVDVLGLPSTTAARVKLARLEKADDMERKAKGLLTVREEEFKEGREMAIKAKKLEEDRRMRAARERALLERQHRNQNLRKKESSLEKSEANHKKAMMGAEMKSAEAERLRGRKRLGRTSPNEFV